MPAAQAVQPPELALKVYFPEEQIKQETPLTYFPTPHQREGVLDNVGDNVGDNIGDNVGDN